MLLPGFRLQVDRDRLLVARLEKPPERRPLVQLAPAPQGIASVGRLDLDDLGAELREQTRREGTGDERPHLDHAQAREGGFRWDVGHNLRRRGCLRYCGGSRTTGSASAKKVAQYCKRVSRASDRAGRRRSTRVRAARPGIENPRCCLLSARGDHRATNRWVVKGQGREIKLYRQKQSPHSRSSPARRPRLTVRRRGRRTATPTRDPRWGICAPARREARLSRNPR